MKIFYPLLSYVSRIFSWNEKSGFCHKKSSPKLLRFIFLEMFPETFFVHLSSSWLFAHTTTFLTKRICSTSDIRFYARRKFKRHNFRKGGSRCSCKSEGFGLIFQLRVSSSKGVGLKTRVSFEETPFRATFPKDFLLHIYVDSSST